MLKKDNQNGDIEFAPVNFDSTTNTLINFKYDLGKSFQEVFYRIDNWINEGSGWIIVLNMQKFLFIAHFQGAHTLNCLVNKKNSMEGLINIKNNDNKSFLWYHIRHLNPLKHILKE